MYRPPNQHQYVPVFPAAQSLLSGATPNWQQEQPRLHLAGVPQTAAAVPSQLSQLQPQPSLLSLYHHAAGGIPATAAVPGGISTATTGITAPPAASSTPYGHGAGFYSHAPPQPAPTTPTSENAQQLAKTQTTPDEKSPRSSTPGDDGSAYVIHLSSKDFYSPQIQQFLNKRDVTIEDTASQSETPVIKSEPEIQTAEVTVKPPKSKRSLDLDQPFVPPTVKEEPLSDDDLIIVDHEPEEAQQKTITAPPKLTQAQAKGQRLTEG